jgi:hypothetical protein
MIMLDAADSSFWVTYPNGAFVYDCYGRRIQNVMSCNPLTGEVISFDDRWASPLHWYFSKTVYRWPHWWSWLIYRDTLPHRHGFWPAPLTLQTKTCYTDSGTTDTYDC